MDKEVVLYLRNKISKEKVLLQKKPTLCHCFMILTKYINLDNVELHDEYITDTFFDSSNYEVIKVYIGDEFVYTLDIPKIITLYRTLYKSLSVEDEIELQHTLLSNMYVRKDYLSSLISEILASDLNGVDNKIEFTRYLLLAETATLYNTCGKPCSKILLGISDNTAYLKLQNRGYKIKAKYEDLNISYIDILCFNEDLILLQVKDNFYTYTLCIYKSKLVYSCSGDVFEVTEIGNSSKQILFSKVKATYYCMEG